VAKDKARAALGLQRFRARRPASHSTYTSFVIHESGKADHLTARESEVRDLLRLGLTNPEIARRLEISVETVKHHVAAIIEKLGVHNRREASYWPERPPWWLVGLAPFAAVRRVVQVHAVVSWTSRVVALLVAAAAIGGLATLALLLRGREGNGGDVAIEATLPAIAKPILLDPPTRISGDGWTFESRVSNLADLNLVVLARDFPSEISLVDVRTGSVVASGTFGGNFDAKLRSSSHELLVTDRNPENKDRLLVFDLSGARPSMAAQAALPERPGYQSNFASASILSSDGRSLFVPLRSWLATPQCQGGGDGKQCSRWSIAVVDIDSLAVTPVPVPELCYDVRLVDGGAKTPFVQCDGRWFAFNGVDTLEGQPWPSYVPFVDAAARRAVRDDGYVITEKGGVVGVRLLPPGVIDVAVSQGWPLGNGRVLLGLNPRPPNNTIYTNLLVANLARSTVESSMLAPGGTDGLVVLDPSRAAVLVSTGDGYEMRLLDLDAMSWASAVPVTGAPSGSLSLAR
jgi:DNA-binding CsgD family transcriptional regulator